MKIGRNDSCRCGSGQKYKKCCEAKDQTARTEQLAAEQAALVDTLDADEAEHSKQRGDAAINRRAFKSRAIQAAPAMRPSHVRKRTV